MGRRLLRSTDHDIDQPAKGWIFETFPVPYFLFIKPEIIMFSGRLKCVMIGMMRLYEDFTFGWAPAGAPSDLRKKIERALSRPEIGQVQRYIRIHHPHERHVRKIKPLG